MKHILKVRLIIQLLFVVLTLVGVLVNSTFTMLALMGFTLLAGAFYCGWICPFGTLQDVMSKLGRLLNIKKRKMPRYLQKYMKYSRYLIFTLVTLTSFNFIFTIMAFDPRANFNSLLVGNIASLSTLLVLISFALISLVFERPFCNYFCSEGAKNGLLSTFRIVTISRDRSTCINCKKCDRACPMNIEVSKSTHLRSLNCINCFNCIAECPVENTLKYGKVNLKGKERKAYFMALISVAILAVAGIVFSIASGNNSPQLSENSIDVSTIYQNANTIASETLYEDGTYTGTGWGFKGNMDVSVTVENNKITAIEVLNHQDDRKWFNRANAVIPQAIIDAQSPNVDTVTGATFSSQGIIEGVEDALKNAKVVTKTPSDVTIPEISDAPIVSDSPSITDTPTVIDAPSSSLYKDGTYTGIGRGFKGDMEVSVTINSGVITAIDVLSHRDDRKWFNRAFNVIPQAIIDAQSPDVDTVTGATFSSQGIIQGARNALENAK